MKISIIGTGYVGLSTGVGFAKKGNHVICFDIAREIVEKINGKRPTFHEPLMPEMLKEVVSKRLLEATMNLDFAITNSDVTFLSVPTPSKADGSIDSSYIREASVSLGKSLKKKGYHLVVVKSTVLPETTETVVLQTLEKFSGKKCGRDFGLCMNPEFLREGSALNDFLNPDRIIIGEFDRKSGDILEGLYKGFDCPVIRTNIKTAEMIKYASNAFLATKISFSNEIGNICKRMGIDTYEVMRGVGLDKRISPHFLNAGIGFGGSCFPKDLNALISKARNVGEPPIIIESVMKTNNIQPLRIIQLLKSKMDLKGKKISVLGLAFKADTDDIREAPSIKIVQKLIEEGAVVSVYDPKAANRFREKYPQISYSKTPRDCLRDSYACLILTDWNEFRNLDDRDFNSMRNRIIIEGRRVLNPKNVSKFEGICW